MYKIIFNVIDDDITKEGYIAYSNNYDIKEKLMDKYKKVDIIKIEKIPGEII